MLCCFFVRREGVFKEEMPCCVRNKMCVQNMVKYGLIAKT